jgi:hypothetical protein
VKFSAVHPPLESFFNVTDFVPGLREQFQQRPLEPKTLLRRRPDGRSLGFVHDYMWQAAALLLGTRTLSQAEFEAIMARLERSCRTFEQGPTSRNYVAALRTTLGQGGDY